MTMTRRRALVNFFHYLLNDLLPTIFCFPQRRLGRPPCSCFAFPLENLLFNVDMGNQNLLILTVVMGGTFISNHGRLSRSTTSTGGRNSVVPGICYGYQRHFDAAKLGVSGRREGNERFFVKKSNNRLVTREQAADWGVLEVRAVEGPVRWAVCRSNLGIHSVACSDFDE